MLEVFLALEPIVVSQPALSETKGNPEGLT